MNWEQDITKGPRVPTTVRIRRAAIGRANASLNDARGDRSTARRILRQAVHVQDFVDDDRFRERSVSGKSLAEAFRAEVHDSRSG
jgi:hypothetical protein